ncbi:hypothetical protein HK107_13695 [Parvularcula sp. ZS-1/3]|uniref:VPLPA-CTERM sorting domain-containing protein n=1 Tax=Parvularcula mediterranea TaxID=2732508 RepID=A0A7Y3RNS2_9PROT|nr:VPLPA-CTERM sorting domain-containing protein [Parvularcula mediterranea]NNU17380.1 hypothetical protein [Parvularcula mediterranea]
MKKSLFSALFSVGALSAAASAAPISNASSGIANADQTITFDEVALAPGTVVTDQYEALGVTFSPNLFYIENFSNRPNLDDPGLASFGSSGTLTTYTINFTDAVSAASLAFSANFGNFTFTALDGGSTVESFNFDAGFSSTTAFFGFEGIVFDAIEIQSSNAFTIIDNLSYSEVPVPAALPIYLGGLAVGGVIMRRRKKARAA